MNGCEDYVYISKQYLQSGRNRDDFLSTAYHEVLHFNDSRWNIFSIPKIERLGFESSRHNKIHVLSNELYNAGVPNTLEDKIYIAFEEFYK